MDGQQGGKNSERERAEDAVAQRLALVGAGQAEHQDGQHQRVVGAEQTLQEHQQPDGEKVGEMDVHQ